MTEPGKQLTGQALYELWQRKLLELCNCESDSWFQLRDDDQGVWEAMADQLRARFNHATMGWKL